MHLILVHIGPEFPTYLNDCIKQIRLVSTVEVIVLIEQIHIPLISSFPNMKIVPLHSITNSEITKTYLKYTVLDKSSRNGFWLSTSLRFFYIYDYVKQHDLKNVFHIEYDNLIYVDFTKFIHIFGKWPLMMILDAPMRCVPSFIYVKNHEALSGLLYQLAECGTRNENDMTALALYALRNPTQVGLLPIITPDYPGVDSHYSDRLKEFGAVFDGAAVGQFIGGVDPRNRSGDSSGFINETTVFKCDRVEITWNKINGLRYPFLNNVPLVNLHIHSKNLRRYMSITPDFITGEKIQMKCDIYCGLYEDFCFNPRISAQPEKFVNLCANPPKTWTNPRVVFCYAHRLRDFRKWLMAAANDFVLVTHNSDENITGSYADIVDHPKVRAMFSQNVLYDHPKLHLLPIGIANSMWPHGDLGKLERVINLHLKKSNDFYFYFNLETNKTDRTNCKNSLSSQGLVFGKQECYDDYLLSLASSKFAFCPTGNGMDSHRIWECLYLGVTPILLRSEFANKLSELFPVVVLDAWSEIDIKKLVENWTQINIFDKLNADYFFEKIYDCSPV